jgi:predicted regulator of Ras-like GTPase activity (Roadblock/LC7/MglB family)
MQESAFGVILNTLAQRCPHLLVAVFFDREGETIDYFSYLDPYETRLLAAHTGIVFGSAAFRLRWLGAGELRSIEIVTDTYDIVILPVHSEFYLTAVMKRGGLDGSTLEQLLVAVEKLALEAGL